MKRYTTLMAITIIALFMLMQFLGELSWVDLGNNLIVGLVTALLTVSLVHWLVVRDQRRTEGLWASEVIFLEAIDVAKMVEQAARFLLADLPPGVEADEQWATVAKSLRRKRQRLGPLLANDILVAVVELEDELSRADFVTARGDDSRTAYARQIVGIWRRYHHLMDRMLPPGDELRKELLLEPKQLLNVRAKHRLDERGEELDSVLQGVGR